MRAVVLALALLATPMSAHAEAVRLLLFGDSLAAGYGLVPEDGFAPALERWLEANGADVEIVNAGLSGDTTSSGRVRLPATLAQVGEIDGVILELGGNDMLSGSSPRAARRNLSAMVRRADDEGPVTVLGIRPEQGDRATIAAWRAIWADLAQRHEVRVVPDLYAIIRERREGMLQDDGVHASASGVQTMVEVSGPVILDMVREIAAGR